MSELSYEPSPLHLNAQQLSIDFDRRPFKIGHSLAGCELLLLPRLIALARELPEQSVEYSSANIPLSQDYLKTPRNGLSIEQTLEAIERCESWMVLKNVEQSAPYKELLSTCLAQVEPITSATFPGMCVQEAFIFVSSPNAVTPYHFDPEHNFLLQIRGTKTVAVFDRADRTIVTEAQLEAMASGAHRNLPFKEEFHAREQLFQLTPGEGVHIPTLAPHWVRNGPEVSVSFSITFRSIASLRQSAIYRTNARLRKLGLSPKPPADGGLADLAKAQFDRIANRMTRFAAP